MKKCVKKLSGINIRPNWAVLIRSVFSLFRNLEFVNDVQEGILKKLVSHVKEKEWDCDLLSDHTIMRWFQEKRRMVHFTLILRKESQIGYIGQCRDTPDGD